MWAWKGYDWPAVRQIAGLVGRLMISMCFVLVVLQGLVGEYIILFFPASLSFLGLGDEVSSLLPSFSPFLLRFFIFLCHKHCIAGACFSASNIR